MRLCRFAEPIEGASRGFDPGEIGQDTIFAVRRGASVHLWRNSCPHGESPMPWRRHAYLYAQRDRMSVMRTARCSTSPPGFASWVRASVRAWRRFPSGSIRRDLWWWSGPQFATAESPEQRPLVRQRYPACAQPKSEKFFVADVRTGRINPYLLGGERSCGAFHAQLFDKSTGPISRPRICSLHLRGNE